MNSQPHLRDARNKTILSAFGWQVCNVPELPEVETIVRQLRPQLSGQKIKKSSLHPGQNGSVWNFLWHPKPANPQLLHLLLRGTEIASLERQGKFISVLIQKAGRPYGTLVVHLGMTGRLLTETTARDAISHKHLRLEIELENGSYLRFIDARRFGRVGFWKQAEPIRPLQNISQVEPIGKDWNSAYLTDLSQRYGKRPIKALLLDQNRIAGLGNIYVDEALWAARIHPNRKAGSLTQPEVRALVKTCRQVLEKGIKNRGTSFSDYVDSSGRKGRNQQSLQVYGRKNRPCTRCRTLLLETRVAGRGTTHCPVCQKAQV